MKEKENRETSLYTITNLVDGKIYIGISFNIKSRWASHLRTCKNEQVQHSGRRKKILYHAMRKHGIENFSFQVIQKFSKRSEASQAEKFWIAEMKNLGYQLYNCTSGGEGVGSYDPTPQYIAKLIKRNKERFADPKQKENMSVIQRGEKNHNCKIKDSEIREIIDLRKYGFTLNWIGDKYGVSFGTISKICIGTRRTNNMGTKLKKAERLTLIANNQTHFQATVVNGFARPAP